MCIVENNRTRITLAYSNNALIALLVYFIHLFLFKADLNYMYYIDSQLFNKKQKNIYIKSIKIVDNIKYYPIFVLSSRILEWVPTERD